MQYGPRVPTQPVRCAEQCGTAGEPGWEIQTGILVLPLSTPVTLAEPLDDCCSHEVAASPYSSPEKESLSDGAFLIRICSLWGQKGRSCLPGFSPHLSFLSWCEEPNPKLSFHL